MSKPHTPDKTREAWLGAAVQELRPTFVEIAAPYPKSIHVSVGWPSTRGLSMRRRRVGECWRGTLSADGTPHIFLSPLVAGADEVLAVLVHELIHAALPDAGHRGPFSRAAKALGLEGKPTSTVAGKDLKRDLATLAKRLGAWPHPELSTVLADRKKQTTRLLKAACPDCDYTIRLTAKWVEVGMPTCPCGEEFELSV